MASVLTAAVAGPPDARDETTLAPLVDLLAHRTGTLLNAPHCRERQEQAAD